MLNLNQVLPKKLTSYYKYNSEQISAYTVPVVANQVYIFF